MLCDPAILRVKSASRSMRVSYSVGSLDDTVLCMMYGACLYFLYMN